jgi:hypothetical protein
MTTCELECDTSVEDIQNRNDLVRVPLESASPELQLVQSLGPLWAEERARAHAAGAPPPRRVPSPERAPRAEDAAALQFRAALRRVRLLRLLARCNAVALR